MAREYQVSEEIERIAHTVINEHHEHLRRASIAYVMKMCERDQKGQPKIPALSTRVGVFAAVAKIRTVPALWQCLAGFDFVVEVDEARWMFLADEQQMAVMDHELCHATEDENGWYVRDHDVEEFADVLARHGAWYGRLDAFVKSAPEQIEMKFDGAGSQDAKSVQ